MSQKTRPIIRLTMPHPLRRAALLSLTGIAWVSGADAQITMRQIGLADRQVVADTMRRVADYQIAKYAANPSKPDLATNWETGTFYTGVLAAYAATKHGDYLRKATDWAEAAKWKVPVPYLNADQLCTAQTYLDIHTIKRDAAMIADTKAALETMFNRDIIKHEELGHVMWKDNERPFIGRNLWWWCDSLYMAPPVLAAMSSATGDPKYRELLHKLYWDSMEFLFDPEEKLVFRDESQFKNKTPAGKKVFWARGNGWVYGGLVRVLDHLPKDDPMREKYLDLFRTLTQSILRYQQPDGLWRTSLNDPSWYPEPDSSGTSFFAYGLLAGINRGYLDKQTFLPAALHAWEGLLGCINPDGRLGYAQLVSGMPGPVRPDNTKDYTHGAFLLAGSELYRMNVTAADITKLKAPQEVVTIQKNGGWTWYNDRRAIVARKHLIVGSLDGITGKSKVGILQPKLRQSPYSWVELDLSSWKSLDDHNNPAFLELSGGRILAIYAKHGAEDKWYWRIATPAKAGAGVDFRWGPEQAYQATSPACYSNPFQLSAEGGRIYNFFRGIGSNPTFVTSEDGAASWSAPTRLIQVDGHRPYVKYADNGKDRIDFLFTDGHPRNQAENNVYHMYYQSGNLYRTDGTLIRSMADVIAAKPVLPGEATLVYAGKSAGRGWVWDLAYGADGNPVAVFINPTDGDEGSDLRYRYARWDAASQKWVQQQIAYAGRHLYVPENHYAGGIAIDPNNVNQVYISTEVDPATGKPGETGRKQIFRGMTTDQGATWTWQQLTFDAGADNIRPYLPRQNYFTHCILWMRGRYDTYHDYDTDIVGILE